MCFLGHAIDINCDMGESFGRYRLGQDEEVMKYITSANIACGFHAGDPNVMRQTVKLAMQKEVGIGAHPGFPDLLGFGRREMNVSRQELRDYLIYQIGALAAFAKAEGAELQHVKAHGALYNMAANSEEMALAVADSIKETDDNLILLVLAKSKMVDICRRQGIRVASEAFADRGYVKDGTLASRGVKGSIIDDPKAVAQRAVMLALEGKVSTVDGDELLLGEIHSICIHGDNPNVMTLAPAISKALTDSGIGKVPLRKLL